MFPLLALMTAVVFYIFTNYHITITFMLDFVFLDTLFSYSKWVHVNAYNKIYNIIVKKMGHCFVGSECSKNLRCRAPNAAENYVVTI